MLHRLDEFRRIHVWTLRGSYIKLSATASRVATCENNTITEGTFSNNVLTLNKQGGGSVDINFPEISQDGDFKFPFIPDSGDMSVLWQVDQNKGFGAQARMDINGTTYLMICGRTGDNIALNGRGFNLPREFQNMAVNRLNENIGSDVFVGRWPNYKSTITDVYLEPSGSSIFVLFEPAIASNTMYMALIVVGKLYA